MTDTGSAYPAKRRAPRNRTLTISESDRARLESELLSLPLPGPLQGLPEGIACGDFGRWIPFVPKESVDLLFLDPPYNLTKSFNGSTFARRGESEYTEWLRSVIGRIVPLLKRSATVYICGDWRTSYSIFDAAAEHLTIRNRITWEREKGRGAKANWKNASEDIWFCTVSDEHYFDVDRVKVRRRVIAPYKDSGGRPKDWDATAAGNFRDTHPSNLWTDISVPFWSMPENTNHPTQKPEKLLAKLLLASTRVGDYVLDPFLGSGTTAVVSRKLHRRCLGIEVNREYCLWALRRLELARSEPSIQGYEDGVFWERNTLRDRRRNRSFRRDRRPKSL